MSLLLLSDIFISTEKQLYFSHPMVPFRKNFFENIYREDNKNTVVSLIMNFMTFV